MTPSANVLRIYREVTKLKNPTSLLKTTKKKLNTSHKRPNTVSINDAFFGDSGKGSVAAKFNALLKKSKRPLYSIGPNGGPNAGHESVINGRTIVMHHLPIAVVQEGATAILTRGKVINPQSLVQEIQSVKQQLNVSQLPGTIVIDERATLTLDTHRVFERALNSISSGGRGSTGRGIAPAYADFYLRIDLTMKDLMARTWKEIFKHHYRMYEKIIDGFGEKFSLKNGVAGSERMFIRQLETAREKLRSYVSSDVPTLLQSVWNNPVNPVTIEFCQGAGLDPFFGVRKDVTASRCLTRSIGDSTYGIVQLDAISLPVAVTKTLYVSSVGQRSLPTTMNKTIAHRIQSEFHESGRTTGRLRDIYEFSVPLAQFLRRADGYQYLVATHLDAAREDEPIRVITHYTDSKTGKEVSYQPYQDTFSPQTLTPHIVEFPGWNGEKVKGAKNTKDLPLKALQYLEFLSHTVAPVVMGTSGPAPEDFLSWLP